MKDLPQRRKQVITKQMRSIIEEAKPIMLIMNLKKGVGIDSAIKNTETRILLSQFSLQKFNPYFWHKLTAK